MADVSTQCSSYEPFWRAHRDNWRPVTPADVWGLREDREFVPPSNAHRKRITRFRPVVTKAVERVADDAARRDLNVRIGRSRAVLAACGCLPAPHTTIPTDYVRPAPMPDGPRYASDHAEQRANKLFIEAQRLAGYGMICAKVCHPLRDALRVYRSI